MLSSTEGGLDPVRNVACATVLPHCCATEDSLVGEALDSDRHKSLELGLQPLNGKDYVSMKNTQTTDKTHAETNAYVDMHWKRVGSTLLTSIPDKPMDAFR